jgi:Cupin domain
MRTWLGAVGVLALLAGCERRHDQEISRSGTDTIIRSSTVKDTTVVRADTSVDVDTLHKTSHIPVGAEDSARTAALNWVRQPPGMPEGGRLAVVRGDPSKAGPFTIRLDLPNGYQVPPHWHPASERVKVLEGTLLMGEGRQWSEKNLRPLGPGQAMTVAARQPHYSRAKGKTMAEIRSTGPFEITYVNTADDPRKSPIQR